MPLRGKRKEDSEDFWRDIKDALYDSIRKPGSILYFIEFPDGQWLMEDRKNKTREPKFALPILYKESAESFLKYYELDKKFGCKVTEHEFV